MSSLPRKSRRSDLLYSYIQFALGGDISKYRVSNAASTLQVEEQAIRDITSGWRKEGYTIAKTVVPGSLRKPASWQTFLAFLKNPNKPHKFFILCPSLNRFSGDWFEPVNFDTFEKWMITNKQQFRSAEESVGRTIDGWEMQIDDIRIAIELTDHFWDDFARFNSSAQDTIIKRLVIDANVQRGVLELIPSDSTLQKQLVAIAKQHYQFYLELKDEVENP